jgi:hypothetical protein
VFAAFIISVLGTIIISIFRVASFATVSFITLFAISILVTIFISTVVDSVSTATMDLK